MMTTILAVLFLIGLCVITMGYTRVQKMAVKLIDPLTEAPIVNASILPADYNGDAVMCKKSIVYMGNKRRDTIISPVYYPDKRIRLAAFDAGVHTMCMRPKSPIALAGFVITNQADKAVLGIWLFKKIAASKVKYKVTTERRRHKHLPVQVPEYRGDRSFRASVRDRPLINGPCPAVKNQLYEKVAEASSKALANLDNWLLMSLVKIIKRR